MTVDPGTPQSPQASEPQDLANVEARVRIAKFRLEMEKIAIDKVLAQRQLAWPGVVLEWVKAGSVFAALVGIAVTLFLGQQQSQNAQLASVRAADAARNQTRQSEENRAADRFDKALSRLANPDIGVRLTGVAGLRLFLKDDNARHQEEALHYLITAVAHEPSREVRQSIRDSFTEIAGLSQDAKDEALRIAVEVDRASTDEYVLRTKQRIQHDKQELLALFLGKKAQDIPADLDRVSLQTLTFEQKMQLDNLDARSIFATLAARDDDQVRLDDLASVITALVGAGARNGSGDWTGIYCQGCDFSAARHIDGARFDHSFLSGANFTHAKLRRSTFADSDLAMANFFGADLRGAVLGWGVHPAGDAVRNAQGMRSAKAIPILECATLYGAVLTGLPLAAFDQYFYDVKADVVRELNVPSMRFVRFDKNTQLAEFVARWDTHYDERYYSALPEQSQRLLKEAFASADFSTAEFRIGSRGIGPSDARVGEDLGIYGTYRALDSSWRVGTGSDVGIDNPYARYFVVALDQPFLRAMPASAALYGAARKTWTEKIAPGVESSGTREKYCKQASIPRGDRFVSAD